MISIRGLNSSLFSHSQKGSAYKCVYISDIYNIDFNNDVYLLNICHRNTSDISASYNESTLGQIVVNINYESNFCQKFFNLSPPSPKTHTKGMGGKGRGEGGGTSATQPG